MKEQLPLLPREEARQGWGAHARLTRGFWAVSRGSSASRGSSPLIEISRQKRIEREVHPFGAPIRMRVSDRLEGVHNRVRHRHFSRQEQFQRRVERSPQIQFWWDGQDYISKNISLVLM
jgi:hypothetical protein